MKHEIYLRQKGFLALAKLSTFIRLHADKFEEENEEIIASFFMYAEKALLEVSQVNSDYEIKIVRKIGV